MILKDFKSKVANIDKDVLSGLDAAFHRRSSLKDLESLNQESSLKDFILRRHSNNP